MLRRPVVVSVDKLDRRSDFQFDHWSGGHYTHHMKRSWLWLLLASVLLWVTPAQAESLDALVKRADMVFRDKTSAAVFDMEVKTKSYQRKLKIVAWDDSRGKEKSLIKILGPASWRGHATLKIGTRLKLYNPKTNHVQVVGHSMLGDSWMGSHFSNDDLVKETRLARDYKLSLLKKWSGTAKVGGKATFYRVSMTPKPTAPVAWGKITYELWSNAKATVPVVARYYRKAGDKKAARTMRFTNLKKLAGRWVPATLTIKVRSKPGEHTRITYRKLKLGLDIPASKFTEQAMKH